MQVSQQFGGQRSQLGLSIIFPRWNISTTFTNTLKSLITGNTSTFSSAVGFADFREAKAFGFAKVDELIIIFCGPAAD